MAQVFQREYESLTRLRHPNIVELLDGGRDKESGERYFVFPWCEKPLSNQLAERPLLGWDDLWERFGREVLEGLSYAHSREVAHRDIKPQNILLLADGRPCLSDFGIAKSIARIAPDVTLRDHATRPFAPPEFDDGRHPTERDVHSYAVLATLALAEVSPFEGYEDDPYRAIDDALQILDVPGEIEAVLKRCMHKDPDARPQNAVVLLEELEGIEDGRGVRRAQAGAERKECHLYLSRKALSRLMDTLDLQTDLQVEEAVADDLSDETALLTFGRETFDDGKPTSGHFFLVGTELRHHLVVAEETRDHLVVVNSWAVGSSALERERERGWDPGWSWQIGRPGSGSASGEAIEELEREVPARAAEEQLRRKEAARERPLGIWRGTLAALRALEEAKESPIRYLAASEKPAGIGFETQDPVSEDLIGQVRVVQGVEGQYLYGEVTEVDRDFLQLMPTRGTFESLPPSGELRVDTTASRSALRRQEQGLDALQYERSLRPELRDLLLDPGTARPPIPVDDVDWVLDLDEPKRRAVGAALGAEDLLAVEGPPGTGKTTFIAELILQELKRSPGSRILVSSQTNAALDNVLERLHEIRPQLRQTRIARRGDARVAPAVQPLLLDQQIDRWRKEVIASGREWLRAWGAGRGISVNDLETAMRLDELAKNREDLEGLTREQAKLATILKRERDPAPEDADSLAAVSERLQEIDEEVATARASTEQAGERLVALKAAKRTADLASSPAELRDQSEKKMPAPGKEADECRTMIETIGDWHARFGRGAAFAAAALLRSQVVAATCVGYASVKGSETIEFDLCIIDEASKAMATEMLVPMTRARRWVLVGDHRQLPPFVDDALQRPGLLKSHRIRLDEVKTTLFDRLRKELPSECVRTLTRQHRMAPAIGGLISECFYGGELSSEPRPEPEWLGIVAPRPVTWFTTSRSKTRFENRHGTTITNRHEAQCIATLLGRVEFAANAAKQKLTVVVLAGYSGQRDLIEREIAPSLREWTHLDIECSTVDSFQGRQADVAIYSVTRSNKKAKIGFLAEERRLNVALSRGRDALILVGDHAGMRLVEGTNPFMPVLDYIEDHGDDCALREMEK